MKLNQLRLKDKINYARINIDLFNNENEILDKVAETLNNGCLIIELVNSVANATKFIKISKKVRELCSMFDALLFVRSRVDIANIVHADGICLKNGDIPVENVKELAGENFITGIQIDDEDDIKIISENNPDYVILKNEKCKMENITVYVENSNYKAEEGINFYKKIK